ncbi:hypothetical protein IHE45_14G024000 [Dioscorea alata]|uniref:Uncharacterized protein n=1 Tax=Dioscorea alata TaxID=55571 RepID=A0ACB7UQG5_DIOAL|nr:hypothetical protein IHE45_14G024000 [Dioscorea alata]
MFSKLKPINSPPKSKLSNLSFKYPDIKPNKKPKIKTEIKKDSKIEYLFFFLKAPNDTREHDDELRATERDTTMAMGSRDREEAKRGDVVVGAGGGFADNAREELRERIVGLELMGLEHEAQGFDLGPWNGEKGCWASFE